MRLTRQTEIAIGILVACARAAGRPVQTRQAAVAAGTTYPHAAKVVHLLVGAGLVATARGRYGGLTLAVPADAITLGAVLRRTQPELVETAEPGLRRRMETSSSLDTIFASARSTFVRLMDRFTIVDLAAKNTVGRLACLDCRLINPAPWPRPGTPQAPSGERSESYALHPCN